MRYFLGLTLAFFWLFKAAASEHSLYNASLGSRESDPESLVENVSTIYGDYSDYEVDLVLPGPDSLVLARYYSSRDHLLGCSSLGGWRFNPHCFLSIQKETHVKSYTTSEGKFDSTHILIGTNEGSILTYSGWRNMTNPQVRSLFKVDVEDSLLGLANTARGNINAWTNLKNNQLYFDAQSNCFELFLSSGGKRFYVPSSSSSDLYLLELEILPSGNKLFYEYEGVALSQIKMTNASEEKVLSWIKIHYGSIIHIDTSDHKTVEYHFQQDFPLLSEVIRSDKPTLKYEYRMVDDHPLLIKKDLPEGRFVEVDYYSDETNRNKVKSLTTPAGISDNASIRFAFTTEEDGSGFTQVDGPLTQKSVYRFNDEFQLTAIEQYLGGELYRVHKKFLGKKQDASNLIAISVEDGNGATHYYKSFTYNGKGHLIGEKEYGHLTGSSLQSLALNEEGVPYSYQKSHAKNYSCRSVKDIDIISQKDHKGSSVKLYYKKGTDLLLKKLLFDKKKIKKRWFYSYNDDGALIQTVVDDGDEEDFESACDIYERQMTIITPKQELPHVGAPEMIEEKYLDPKKGQEILLKKRIFGFDRQGNVQSIAIYDAKGDHRYTLKKIYEQGLLSLETDPLGNETRYTYDDNQNLTSIVQSNSNLSFEYQYDLKNRLICSREKDGQGNCFETLYTYDAAGNKTSETDHFGHKTVYVPDDLGRIIFVSYPKVQTDEYSSITPSYAYSYDLFGSIFSMTDPTGGVTQKTYTVHGSPASISYPDGTKELFKYDPEGSLHRHLGRDGIIRIFEYDYQGRLAHIEYYERGSKGKREGFKREYYEYDAFQVISHEDVEGAITTYAYDGAGRLSVLTKGDQKTEFLYDSLGRAYAAKKWKSAKTFTLEVKERDLLDRVIEERTEDAQGKVLLKSRCIYHHAGQLQKIIGYPQNQESILATYEYDDFGHLREIKDPFGSITHIENEDLYMNEWGQKVLKRITTDPLGSQTEEIFDPAGRLAKTIKKDRRGQILAESAFFFDAAGNLRLEKNDVIANGNFLRTYKTQESYAADKLKSRAIAAGSSEERTTAWEYDIYGALLNITKPGIKEPITYGYDPEGNVQSISYKDENEAKKTTYQLSYDNKQNITEIKLGKSRTIHYKRSPNNQLKSEKIKDEFGTYEVKLEYDGQGCIEVIQLPDGSLIKYTYEGPFVKSISRQSKEKKELYNHRITSRDQMGHILEEVLVGHVGERKQTWNKAGRRTGIFTDFLSDEVPEGGYDLFHNIKKKTLTLDGQAHSAEYEYNALHELISEKGEKEHTYSYDSLGNRLSYKTNDLNQTLEAGGEIFSFNPMGHLEIKTAFGKTWNFQTSPLGHLLSIQDPHQTAIALTYDLNGKRLSKKVEAKGKKPKIYRYFYLGQTELGCLDEKGNILELKVPGNPNDPEPSSCIAIEIKKEPYVPLYDIQGNVSCLVDPERREIVESYRYSAFGEEEMFNQRGKKIADSAIGNPWRYKLKRIDQETGLIYFGKRYYDPKTGRWISPDPLGSLDDPNLYRFCRNNPLTFVDYFGLASETNGDEFSKYFYGEYEPHCHCERHRDCKRGGDVGSSLGMGFLSNPHFQGSMQAFNGLVEASIGGGMTFVSGGVAAPLGCLVMAHGLDQFFTGMNLVFAGSLEDSVTSQLLQEMGFSPYVAGLIDNGLSIVGSMGGTAAIRTSQLAAFPYFRLPTQGSQTTLYRVVQPAELVDIQKTGIFRNLGDAEGKYFTSSIEGASSYARQAVIGFGDPPYTLVRTQVPNNILNGIPPTLVDGGIPAWVIHDRNLEGLIPEIITWMTIPK
ncbi:MAG: RHS repeat-associated core domain-containing protein [Chlamydiales bacterium]|nr:RHS repeat-associated core domain-containing protein [Chlamydiales bacterium]